jgi:hypothetical protein
MFLSDWVSKSGKYKLEKLLETLDKHNVSNVSDPNARFQIDRSGFLIFCKPNDPPAQVVERQGGEFLVKLEMPPTARKGILYVGRCRWLWSTDNQDLIGVSLHTDVNPAQYHTYSSNQRQRLTRLNQQNRPDDVAWAVSQIRWLWRVAIHRFSSPKIYLITPIPVKSDDDYIDMGDFMK